MLKGPFGGADLIEFLGLTEAEQLVPVLRDQGLLSAEPVSIMERPLRLISTSTPHTSYLKISEGCDHTCAFCAIPLMRGKHRSTPIEALVKEAQELERGGVVELNVVSQDTTWYGRDIARGLVAGEDEYFVGKTFAGMAGVVDGQGRGHANGKATGEGRLDLMNRASRRCHGPATAANEHEVAIAGFPLVTSRSWVLR